MNKQLSNLKKKLIALGLTMCVGLSSFSLSFADSARVVTLGANLSESQKQTILKYFGVNENEVVVLEVNNQEEREYLEGIASESQIGTKTYSCAYVEPTKAGSGINVKTANITWVTASMVATTLSTAGLTDANVVIAANFPVSGTGALTGIMKAFEDATGEFLDEEKKELATEELVITGDLGEDIGQDKATGIINDIKLDIIKNNTSDTIQIAETITNVTNNYNITLTPSQEATLVALMEKISKQDYKYDEMKDILNDVKDSVNENLEAMGEDIKKSFSDTIADFFDNITDWFKNLFASNDNGILEQTNDELLGENAQIDATDKSTINLPSSDEVEGFFTKILNWFKGLFDDINSDNVESEGDTTNDNLNNDNTDLDNDSTLDDNSSDEDESNNDSLNNESNQ